MSVKELKAKAVRVLAAHVDGVATDYGFRRSPKGLAYRRKTDDLLQKVEVGVQRPNSYPRHVALVQPRVWCESEKICEDVLKLVRGRKDTLYGPVNLLFNLPIGFWSEKQNAVTWEPHDHSSWDAFGRELAASLDRLVFLTFDEFSSLPALVQGYRNDDRRLLALNPCPVQIAAAFIVAKDVSGARAFLSRRLALRGLNKWERKLAERILPRIE